MKTASDLDASFEARPIVSGRAVGLSGRAILICGTALVVTIGTIAAVTFQTCRTLIHRSVARDNLTIAETFARIAVAENGADRLDDFLDGVQKVWLDSDLHDRQFSLSVFDQVSGYSTQPESGADGEADRLTPESVIRAVSLPREAFLLQSEGGSQDTIALSELLILEQSMAGWLTSPEHEVQLTGFHFEPTVNALLGIHIPMAAVDREFRQTNLPWIVALFVVGGVLAPIFLGLLYVQNRRAATVAREHIDRLQNSETRFRRLYQNSPYCIHEIDSDGRLTAMNESGLKMLGLACEADVVGCSYLQSVCEEDRDRIQELLTAALQGQKCHFEFKSTTEPARYFRSCFIPVPETDAAHSARLMGLTEDITQQVRTRNLIRTENRMLSFAAMGHPTTYLLDYLVTILEDADDRLMLSVYLVDDASGKLRLKTKGRLPDSYNEIVAEIDVREGLGSCGTAAFRGETVNVDDIQSHAFWEGYHELTRQHNLAACSSIPILAGDGEVLGTIGCYRREAGPLNDDQQHLLHSAANLAGMAISRRKAQSRLREQEAIFRGIFDQAAVGVSHVETATGRMIRVNRRYAQIVGANAEDLTGRCWMELTHPDDVSAGQENIRRLMSAEIREYTSEKRLLSQQDGHPVWIKLTVSAMWAPADEPQTHICIAEDITEAKLSEQALKLSETRYRSLVTSSAAIVWTTDAKGHFVHPQASWFRYTGQKWDRHQGTGWVAMLHPDDVDRMTSAWQRVVREPGPFYLEGRIYHADRDAYRYCEVRATPIRDEHGQVLEWVGTTVDVDDRRQAEAALRESEKRYRAVVNDQTEFIVRWKPDGVRTFVNDAYCRCFGEAAEDMIGTSFFPLIKPSDLQNVKDRLGKLTPEEPYSTDTHRVLLPDGSTAWHEWTDRALFDDDGRLLGYQSVGRDITARKVVEKQLRDSEHQLRQLNAELEQRVGQRTARLQQANEDLEAYAQSVAHDLRAPLRAISGFAMALEEDCPELLNEQSREYIDFIKSAAQQMDDLICDLLTYSRIGQSEMSIDRHDLDDVLQAVRVQLRKDIEQSQAELDVRAPLGIVTGHRSTLVQMFSNLISNAIKFVKPGVRPKIQIFSTGTDGFLRISVQDNGIGIDPESHQLIFRVFERLHGIETYPGTGIGLAIVRRAAESLNGRFGVESNPDQGSLFWLELPCKEPVHA
ncbi:MAG: hypothetical protein Fues2KO_03030 [Fuerstiella sp.]